MSTTPSSPAEMARELEQLRAQVARLRQEQADHQRLLAQARLAQTDAGLAAQELSLLADLGRSALGALSLQTTVTSALRALWETLRPDMAFILLRHEDRLFLQDMLPPEAAKQWRKVPEHQVGQCLCGLAVKEKRAIYSLDIGQDPRCTWQECKLAGVKSFAALPLNHGGQTLGVLGLASFQDRDFAKRGPFIEILAAQVAVAVANARVVERLRQELAERERAQQALQESELHFRALFEESPLGISLIDQRGHYEYLNPAFVQLFGYTLDDLHTREDWFRLAYPDAEYRRKVSQLWLEDVRNGRQGKSTTRTLKITCRDRTQKTILIKAVGIPSGKHFVLYDDITDRLRAEEEIKNSEATLRSILQASPSGVGMASFPERKVLWANQRICQMTGYAIEELLGQPVSMLYRDQKEFERVRELAMEQMRARDQSSVESQWRRKDGTWLEVLLSISPVNPADLRAGLVFTALDITESKQSREQVRQSEEKFRLVLETSPYPVVLYDTQGRVLYLNPSFSEVFGWTQEELLGKRIDFVPPEEWPKTQQMLDSMSQGLSEARFETRRHDKQGNLIDVVVSWSVWRDAQGEPAGSMTVLRDVTEHNKMLAQLEQSRKMEAIGALAGGIAHDFNNVLAAISGNVQLMLLRPDLDDSLRDTLAGMDNLTQRAAEMIQQLLTLGRRQRAQLKPISLNQEIRLVCRLLERIIPRMVSLELNLAPDLRQVQADPSQLEQIMLNLAGNATQAMPEGGRLMVTTHNLDLDPHFCQTHPPLQPGPHVQLSVADTGGGMDEETLKHIFEPFFTTKEDGQGTGLGLSTVYGIVKQHHGLITCYSEPGQGSLFNIYLPASAAAGAQPAPEGRPGAAELRGGPETVLLVDDEQAILTIGREILDMYGYRVLEAHSGEEAIQVYREQGPRIDLVILDLNMPGMGGKRCLELMLEINPAAKVIISSGYATPSTAKLLQEAGAAGFIGKPYRLADMVTRVREVLDQGPAR